MKKAKKTKFSVAAGIVGFILLTGIVAYAAFLYYSNSRINMFSEGEAEIKVVENDDAFQAEPDKPFKWLRENELDDESSYGVTKVVQVKSMRDDQYVRVQIVPSWRDEAGNICAPDYISDFSCITVEDGKLLFKRTENSEPTITCVLADGYGDNWDFDDKTHCFTYKRLLAAGETTEPLMTYVRIDSSVYSLTKDSLTGTEYTLNIDVLTDSIEPYGDASETRNFNTDP